MTSNNMKLYHNLIVIYVLIPQKSQLLHNVDICFGKIINKNFLSIIFRKYIFSNSLYKIYIK